MNWKGKVWKYATGFTVAIIILKPELAEMALFIDAVGLEMFLLLLEVQIIAIFGGFFNKRIKPVYIYIRNLILRYTPVQSWATIKNEPEILMLAVPTPAFLMNALVISFVFSLVFKASG